MQQRKSKGVNLKIWSWSGAYSCKTIDALFGLDGRRLEQQYIHHLSGFMDWAQREHAGDWILFPENIGGHLSIDETSLSQGELYTIVTNKAAKGKKRTIVAMVKGTESEKVIEILQKIPAKERNKVKEVTLDLAPTMERIVCRSFPKASQVSDRFHVQKLASDAVQEIRIKYRWEAIEQENKEIELAREVKSHLYLIYWKMAIHLNSYLPEAVICYSRMKPNGHHHRSAVLNSFFLYILHWKTGYRISRKLSYILSNTKDKGVGFTKLAQWYDSVEKAGISSFNTIARTIQNHYITILNYSDNKITNASAESFNAKVKALRSQFRGVRNVTFFLFRLTKIYA
jgi:transposase